MYTYVLNFENTENEVFYEGGGGGLDTKWNVHRIFDANFLETRVAEIVFPHFASH